MPRLICPAAPVTKDNRLRRGCECGRQRKTGTECRWRAGCVRRCRERRGRRRGRAARQQPRRRGPDRAGNCASRPATTPVRTSPLPPLAMPGLPEVLTAMRPSGWATRVRAPLSTRMTPWRAAKPRAMPRRSSWTSAVVRPARRAISPGCGVRTTVRPPGARPSRASVARRSGCIARMLSASASRTAGMVVACRQSDARTGRLRHSGPGRGRGRGR